MERFFFFFFKNYGVHGRGETEKPVFLKGRRLHLMNSRKYVLNTTCQLREQIGTLMFGVSALNPDVFSLIDGHGRHCLHWLWKCPRSDAVE